MPSTSGDELIFQKLSNFRIKFSGVKTQVSNMLGNKYIFSQQFCVATVLWLQFLNSWEIIPSSIKNLCLIFLCIIERNFWPVARVWWWKTCSSERYDSIGHKKLPMLVFEDAELFRAKGRFHHSGLIHLLPYLKIDVENDTQKLPRVAKAVILNSRDVYKRDML